MILSTIAFCLPGSVLPKNDWLGEIQIDKWIHVGLFSIMVVLWCFPFLYRSVQRPVIKLFAEIAVVFFTYGVLMELVQHFLVPRRSFDWGDIAADAVGCLFGFFFMRKQWKK